MHFECIHTEILGEFGAGHFGVGSVDRTTVLNATTDKNLLSVASATGPNAP